MEFLRLTMICGVSASIFDDELDVEAVILQSVAARSAGLPTGSSYNKIPSKTALRAD